MKENLKKIRLTLGYNLNEFAKKLNISINTYMGYEYKAKVYPLDFLNKLVDVFNVNLHYLYTGQGEMFISEINNTLEIINTLELHDNSKFINNVNSFYKRFNKIQKENELNDRSFSKITGISESRIEKLGIGKATPTIEELNAIKQHFDVSIDWLLYGDLPQKNAQSEVAAPTLSIEEINVLKKMAEKFNL